MALSTSALCHTLTQKIRMSTNLTREHDTDACRYDYLLAEHGAQDETLCTWADYENSSDSLFAMRRLACKLLLFYAALGTLCGKGRLARC